MSVSLDFLRGHCRAHGVKIRWISEPLLSRASVELRLIEVASHESRKMAEQDAVIVGMHELGHIVTSPDLRAIFFADTLFSSNEMNKSLLKLVSEELAWNWALKHLPQELLHDALQIRELTFQTYISGALSHGEKVTL